MRKNFVINQSMYIVHSGNYYDLHNDYRFTELLLYPHNKEVKLNWVKINSNWVPKESAEKILLNFQGVTFFQISDGLIKESVEQIQEIGYKEGSDFDLEWLILKKILTNLNIYFSGSKTMNT